MATSPVAARERRIPRPCPKDAQRHQATDAEDARTKRPARYNQQRLRSPNWAALAEPIPGPTSDSFCEKARRLGAWICPGSIIAKEAETDRILNTALLISPTGEIVLKYRKTFIGGLRHRVPVSQVRAMENQCYLVSVNQAAPEGMGHSTVCDPEGRILEELDAGVVRGRLTETGRGAAGA
jgi:predicted amidohydrolase